MRGLEWEPGSAALRELLEEAAQDLTLERLSQAREEALRGGSPAGGGGGAPRDRGDHRAELTFHFPEVRCSLLAALRAVVAVEINCQINHLSPLLIAFR